VGAGRRARRVLGEFAWNRPGARNDIDRSVPTGPPRAAHCRARPAPTRPACSMRCAGACAWRAFRTAARFPAAPGSRIAPRSSARCRGPSAGPGSRCAVRGRARTRLAPVARAAITPRSTSRRNISVRPSTRSSPATARRAPGTRSSCSASWPASRRRWSPPATPRATGHPIAASVGRSGSIRPRSRPALRPPTRCTWRMPRGVPCHAGRAPRWRC